MHSSFKVPWDCLMRVSTSSHMCVEMVGAFRRGIGRELLRAAEELAIEMGCSEVYLHCRMIDSAPLTLYQKCGYQIVETDNILSLLTFQRRRHLMRKTLTASSSYSLVNPLWIPSLAICFRMCCQERCCDLKEIGESISFGRADQNDLCKQLWVKRGCGRGLWTWFLVPHEFIHDPIPMEPVNISMRKFEITGAQIMGIGDVWSSPFV